MSNKWAESYGGHWEHSQRQYDRMAGVYDYAYDYADTRLPPWSSEQMEAMTTGEFYDAVNDWMYGKDSGVSPWKMKQDWTWMNWLFILFTVGFFLSLMT